VQAEIEEKVGFVYLEEIFAVRVLAERHGFAEDTERPSVTGIAEVHLAKHFSSFHWSPRA
jgi:hypothetical protein